VVDAFIYADRVRCFTTTRDFALDAAGKRKWDWITGFILTC